MTTRKLTSVDAFVINDLDDAPLSAGIVRLAPKLLVDGASWLARSQTYQFASFERRIGGASAGINSPAESRAEAITAFLAEFEPESSTTILDAGKGLGAAELGGLRAADPRPAGFLDAAPGLRTEGIVAATELALGGLDARTVAIEGFDAAGLELARALILAGAHVVAISTASGTAMSDAGFDLGSLTDAWAAHGVDLVSNLGVDAAAVWALFGAKSDALLVGSKAGALDHKGAAHVRARVVVPTGPLPVSAKALAMLTAAGVVVLPDFIVTAGPLVAWPVDGSEPSSDAGAARALVAGALGEVLGHERGALLAACERAEAFLLSWRTDLPFGRPIA